MPASNVAYWEQKIRGNQARDRRTSEELAKAGWAVLRFLEHDPPNAVAAVIAEELKPKSGALRPSGMAEHGTTGMYGNHGCGHVPWSGVSRDRVHRCPWP